MRRANLNRRAKIVATLGPSSSDTDIISKLILGGMNVARLNMSHGTYADHAKLIENLRSASKEVGLEVALVLDLQGPKIRMDRLERSLDLKDGDIWYIGPTNIREKLPEYKDSFIPTVYEQLVNDCRERSRILFDDGLIITEVVKKELGLLKIKVLSGGLLKSNKGINLPDSKVSASSFTAKDHDDLMFGIENGIDYVALSFVRKKEDVLELKEIIKDYDREIPIISKIENLEAIENIEEILDVSDVIMVARGDLGVEIGNHLVPSAQKRIISLCNDRGKPVITATQMLESMIINPSPTRAESSDVANAIWDGTDAVMLSGETASGKYPLESLSIMGKIISEAENTPKSRASLKEIDLTQVDSATMIGASLIAEKINAKRILSVTQSGSSCLKMSLFRPCIPVLGVSNSIHVVRRMCLYWGVSPFYLKDYDEDDIDLEKDVIEKAKTACELEKDNMIVITRGSGKFFARGTSNSIKVEQIK